MDSHPLPPTTAPIVTAPPAVREVLDCLPTFVALLAPDGSVQYINRTPLMMAGLALEPIVGMPLWLTRWWHEDGDPQAAGQGTAQEATTTQAAAQVREACERAARGESTRRDVPMWRRDGERFLADLSVVPLPGPDGRARQITVTAVDVGAGRLPSRSSSGGERRKDEFLAMLAHELRNPLAPLRNAASLMRLADEGDGHSRRSAITSLIDRQVKQMSRLLDDLLDASRIDQGKISLMLEPVELGSLLAETLEGTKALTDERGQHVLLSSPSRPLWLNADPIRVTQIIENLVTNAAKFTDTDGTIRVMLSASRRTARLSVADNGQGIDADLLPRVFELFIQGTRSLDRSQGGLGIGLALVRNLVLLHGGNITAHSAGPGRGSEFVVTLPLLARHRRRAVQPVPDAAPFTARRVLVVDDNVDAAQSLAELLSLRGHDIRTASDSRTALALAAAFAPEVVLLDIGLPEIDGFEVARLLRRMQPTRHALLVALTGYGRPEDRKASGAAGFDHHLVKPVALQQIEELIAGQTAVRS